MQRIQSGVYKVICKGSFRQTAPVRNFHFNKSILCKAATEGAAPVEPEPVVEVDPLVKAQLRIKELETEAKESRDRVLRSYAEEENVRRIAKKDVEDARNYANTSFAKALLDVSDNMERAMSSIPSDKRAGADAEGSLKVLMDGMVLINKDLSKVFAKFHVKQYGAAGDKFNPNIHEALYQIPLTTPEQIENTVGQVVKTGYMLKDRVLRPAEVGIIVKQSASNTAPVHEVDKSEVVSGGY